MPSASITRRSHIRTFNGAPAIDWSYESRKAGRLAEAMIQSARSEPTEILLESVEIWQLVPGYPIARVLRPRSLEFDDWESLAYGAPSDSDDDLLRWLAWTSVKEPTPVAWWSGTRLLLYPKETLSRAIAQSGAYEPETAVMLKRLLPRGGVFVDAGANSGVFSLPASRWVGPDGLVVAIEPSSRELAKLRANIELNSARNVQVVGSALGAKAGRGRMLIGDAANAGLNTLGPALAHGAEPSGEESVAVTTVDRLCSKLKLERLDLLKADVEGGELKLLQGGRKTIERFRPALVIEVEQTALEPADQDVGELESLLDELGYRMFALNAGNAIPHMMSNLAGFSRGNILAVPAEKSEELERRSDEARHFELNQNLVEQLAAVNAALVAEREYDRTTYETKLNTALYETERLQADLRQATLKFEALDSQNREGINRRKSEPDGRPTEAMAESEAARDQPHWGQYIDIDAPGAIQVGRQGAEEFSHTHVSADQIAREAEDARRRLEVELEEAQHEIHQLESNVLQQRNALDDQARQLAELRAKAVANQERAIRAEAALDAERANSVSLTAALKEASLAYVGAEQRAREAADARTSLESELEGTQRRIHELENDVRQQRDALDERARALEDLRAEATVDHERAIEAEKTLESERANGITLRAALEEASQAYVAAGQFARDAADIRKCLEADLEDARQAIHQLESNVLQQRGALDDEARELEEWRGKAAADQGRAIRAEAALEAERANAVSLGAALEEASQARSRAEQFAHETMVARRRLETELERTTSAHATEMAARDDRFASLLKTMNTRQIEALVRAGAEAQAALEAAEQGRLAREADMRAEAELKNNLEVRLREETAALQSSLHVVGEHLRAREVEIGEVWRKVEQIEYELRDRNRLLEIARGAPFRFFLKRFWISVLNNVVRPIARRERKDGR